MEDFKQELFAKLAQFFQIKNKNTEEIIYPIYQSLMGNVTFDPSKLSHSLDTMLALKDKGFDFAFQNEDNIFDIATENGKVKVKAVIANNKPVLFFYNKDNQIFFKIKRSTKNGQSVLIAESSINEHDVSKEKLATLVTPTFFYCHNDKVYFDEESYLLRTRTLAKTGKENDPFFEDDMCDEYKNFYRFLMTSINKTGKKSLEDMSVIKADFIFSSFYQNLKDMCKLDDEFSASEIVYLLDNILNGGKSGLLSPLESDSTIKKGKYSEPIIELGKVFASVKDKVSGRYEIGEGEQQRIITFCASEKYASIHILDSNNVEQFSYIIGQTDKGFTLFKAIKDESLFRPDSIAKVFTLNLTNSTLRINASARLNNRTTGNSLESDLDFLPDGEITLVNTTFKGDAPSLANVRGEKIF